eukprot:366501-Chlamydomonas_euryale.AAC.8
MEALRFPLNPFSHFGHVRVRRLEQATPRPAGRFVRDRVDLTGFARPAAAYCLIKPQSSQSEGRTSGRRILVAVGEEHHAKVCCTKNVSCTTLAHCHTVPTLPHMRLPASMTRRFAMFRLVKHRTQSTPSTGL